jgi:hypothetical protein
MRVLDIKGFSQGEPGGCGGLGYDASVPPLAFSSTIKDMRALLHNA